MSTAAAGGLEPAWEIRSDLPGRLRLRCIGFPPRNAACTRVLTARPPPQIHTRYRANELADAKRNQYMFSIGFGKSQENVQALKSALRAFGSCAEGCAGNVGGKAACTCGYHEAMGGE